MATKTIDITPTWVQAAKIIALALTSGTDEGKKIAREELHHMAQLADRFTESIKNLIDDQRREDMIVGAIEGGSNYWYWINEEGVKVIYEATDELNGQPFSTRMWAAIKAGKTIDIHDIDDKKGEKIGQINLQSIYNGEFLMLTQYKEQFANIISENDDAGTADVWFQLVSLGELVYG